jgi:hypothetical protein
MTYEILEIKQTVPPSLTIFTVVKFNFNGVEVISEFPHFNPENEAAIVANIQTRAAFEQQQLADMARLQSLIPTIPTQGEL